jgi:hypothetical protein
MYKWLIIVSLVLLPTLCFAKRFQPDTMPSGPMVTIQAFNPVWFTISMEIKCDHDYLTNKYKFYKIITIPGKSAITIRVPASMKNCEIWSKIGTFDD